MPLITKTDFPDRLLVYPEVRIILCNILDGLDEDLFTHLFVQELIDWWRGLFLWRLNLNYAGKKVTGKVEKEGLMSSLKELLFQKQPVGYRDGRVKPSFPLVCTRKARTTVIERSACQCDPVRVFH